MSTVPSWSQDPKDYMNRRNVLPSACTRMRYTVQSLLSHRKPLSPVDPPALQPPDDPGSRFVTLPRNCQT